MQHEEENIRKQLGNRNPEKGFNVPDGYFDTFSSKVKDQIASKQATHKGFTWGRLLRPVYSIPVAAAIVLLTGYFVFFNSPDVLHPIETVAKANVATTDDIPTETIEEYLAQEVSLVGMEDEIDKDLLALAYAPDEVTTETQEETKTVEPVLTDSKDSAIELSDDEIEEYLMNTYEDDFLESL